MNFLSHFYFEKNTSSSYQVLGMLMPDLVKNADKSWNIHPEKNETNLFTPAHQEILNGWKRHLIVDKVFHGSSFFKHHQHELKIRLKPHLIDTKIKPFFLGHIALELLLDSIILFKKLVNTEVLYHQLDCTESDVIADFLTFCGVMEPNRFISYFEIFKKEQYLNSYLDVPNITYALNKICMRIWKDPFTQQQSVAITQSLAEYKVLLEEDFISIFDLIDTELR